MQKMIDYLAGKNRFASNQSLNSSTRRRINQGLDYESPELENAEGAHNTEAHKSTHKDQDMLGRIHSDEHKIAKSSLYLSDAIN